MGEGDTLRRGRRGLWRSKSQRQHDKFQTRDFVLVIHPLQPEPLIQQRGKQASDQPRGKVNGGELFLSYRTCLAQLACS